MKIKRQIEIKRMSNDELIQDMINTRKEIVLLEAEEEKYMLTR